MVQYNAGKGSAVQYSTGKYMVVLGCKVKGRPDSKYGAVQYRVVQEYKSCDQLPCCN